MATLKTNTIVPTTGSSVGITATSIILTGSVTGITTLIATGNVTASGFTGSLTGNASSATTATSATSATSAGTVTTAAQPNITSVGTLTGLSLSGKFGYLTGGAAIQITSKSTGVTLNTLSGTIQLAAVATVANTLVTFTLTNNLIAATDILLVVQQLVTGTGAIGANYTFSTNCGSGSAAISMRNQVAIVATEVCTLRFIVIKAPT